MTTESIAHLTLDLDAGVLRRHNTYVAWTTGSPTSCDNCGGDLPVVYGQGILYGEQVNTCTATCFITLHRVWAPRARSLHLVRHLITLAATVLLWLGR